MDSSGSDSTIVQSPELGESGSASANASVFADSPDLALRGSSAWPTPAPTSPDSPSADHALPSVHRTKLKRNRLILSCQPCHKRKQQCDRGHPCRRCVKRGTTDECSYEQPEELGKRKVRPEPSQDTGERVSDESNVNGVPTALVTESRLPGVDDILGSVPLGAGQGRITQGADAHPQSPSNSAVELAAAALGQLAQQATGLPSTNHQPMFPQPPSTSFAEIFSNADKSCTDDVGRMSFMARYLEFFPNKKVIQFLFRHYFDESSFHWMWPIIHRPHFEAFFQAYTESGENPGNDVVAMIAAVLAISLQFLSETSENNELLSEYPAGRHALQDRMFVFADSHLNKWADFPQASIERVQGHMLLVLYEWNRGNGAASQHNLSIAIRMAQSLSMNRDGIKHWGLRPRDAEIRRRLWWLLFTMDRWQCTMFNRPYMIHEQHVDTALPMNLDQVDVVDVLDLETRSHEVATDTLFHIQYARFQQLSGRVWDNCFSGIHLPTYRNILDFESEIRQFELKIPAALRYQTTQEERSRPYLSFQNTVMSLELSQVRINLLAPFLFVHPTPADQLMCMTDDHRKLADFHRNARAVCLLYVKRQLALLQMFHASSDRTFLTWPGHALVAYTAATMLVVAIIIQPDHATNDELEEWITIAEDLLKISKSRNIFAPAALERMDVICRRLQFVRCISGTPRPAGNCRIPSPDVTMNAIQRMERAVKVLAQPVSSMADRLGYDTVTDLAWANIRPPMSVYMTRFPGADSLNHPVEELETFFDRCAAVHVPCF